MAKTLDFALWALWWTLGAAVVLSVLLYACETSPDCEGCRDDYAECANDAGWDGDCLEQYCDCLRSEGCCTKVCE